MPSEKESKDTVKNDETTVVKQPVAVPPVVAEPAKQEMSKQTKITLMIVSGVVLFFMGLGFGYLLGHGTSARTFPTNGIQFPGGDDGGRRFYPNSSRNNSTNGGSTTTPKTQTN